ncbi:MAG: hypothetical protein A2Y77_14305 [Planctomycetes bacterium RBG_13_62_9]|nr:MAG: hypothetical protein A2Y77_14305 [Planctomycetes bacterium RBG_13_62_9]
MHRMSLACLIVVTILESLAVAEVQVNVRTSGTQANAAVAGDGSGGWVIVWSSYYTTPGRSNDILARRLDTAGRFPGDEFHVNVMTGGNQTEPAVAMGRRGQFAVVWQGPGPDQEDIFLRLFDPNGVPATDELLVNLNTSGRQLYPSVAVSESGTLVVVWESREPVADGDIVLVCAQLFDPNGSGLGGEIVVGTDLYDCRYPDVAMDQAGRFAVTWMRDRTSHPITARLFDCTGVPLADPFEVNTARISSITRPSIAMSSLGDFVIAWDGDANRASEDDVHARLFDLTGVPRGEPFLVNTIRMGAQQWPRVAVNDANEFVIVWEHDTAEPNALTEVFARRFGCDGVPAGDQFQLNTHTPDRQRYADVALADDGSFVATWESNGQDNSGYGVFAHLEPPSTRADPNDAPSSALQ